MDELSFDTTFLIDFHRERRRGEGGPAHRFAESNAKAGFCLSTIAFGEFAVGFGDPEDPVLIETREAFRLLPADNGVAFAYRKIFRRLQQDGLLIGANDMWIAACSLRSGLPLVTRNLEEFHRVPTLHVIGY